MRQLFVIVTFIMCTHLYAQRVNIDNLFLKRAYVSLSGGLGLPVMEYGQAKHGPSTGYAMLGSDVRLEVGLEVSRGLGIKAMCLSGSNPFDDKQYTKDFMATNPGGPGLTFNYISANSWKYNGVMIGVFYPIRNVNTTYELKMMVGVINSTLPQQDFIYTEDSTHLKVDFRLDQATSNNIGYLGGIDIRHRLSKDWLIKANFDFLYTEQNYSELNYYLIYKGRKFYVNNFPDYLQYFHIIGMGVGIAYQIDTN